MPAEEIGRRQLRLGPGVGRLCCQAGLWNLEPVRTWGVDLSTSESGTGVVSIDWVDGGRGVFKRHRGAARTRTGLVEAIAETATSEWWAIDVPFGWPSGWGDFLARHSQGPTALPGNGQQIPWRSVARRVTDLQVVDRAFPDGRQRTPGFSVSFDKLGATAAAWAWVEWQLDHQHGLVLDRSGVSDTVKVCETYPAAVWRQWFKSKNPSSAGTETFRAAVEGILEPADGTWEMSGHERDAVICAVAARTRALNRTRLPRLSQGSAAAREGWIHLPSDDVLIDDLLPAPRS